MERVRRIQLEPSGIESERREGVARSRPDEASPTVPPEPPADPAQGANVQVISGASVQSLPLSGLRVERAREALGHILQIDPRAPVLVNGRPARSWHRLAGGDTLEFVHHAGEKGGGHGPASGDRRRAGRL